MRTNLSGSFPLALGTAGFGTQVTSDMAKRLLDFYVCNGGNHLDTAHDYASWLPGGDGASERTIGEWLRTTGIRDQLIIGTKAGCTHHNQKRVRETIIRGELLGSLARLGISEIDIFWLHRDDPSIPVSEILGWLEELSKENLIVDYGACNWSSSRLAEARLYARQNKLRGFIASQCGWNLAALNPNEFSIGDAHFITSSDQLWHEQTAFPLVAYESQGSGFFSGLYSPTMKPSTDRMHAVYAHYGNDTNWRRLDCAKKLATKYQCTPNQICLAWLKAQPFQVIPLIGPRTAEHLADSLGALTVKLSRADAQRLRSAHDSDE